MYNTDYVICLSIIYYLKIGTLIDGKHLTDTFYLYDFQTYQKKSNVLEIYTRYLFFFSWFYIYVVIVYIFFSSQFTIDD